MWQLNPTFINGTLTPPLFPIRGFYSVFVITSDSPFCDALTRESIATPFISRIDLLFDSTFHRPAPERMTGFLSQLSIPTSPWSRLS